MRSIRRKDISGFFQSDIMDYLEGKNLDYVVAARFTHPIQRIIDAQQNWILLDTGIEICEQMYQMKPHLHLQ